ncbi:MAG TPA: MBL fold metallo-hydrolase [Chitinophagaceae bacterium]|nr:MBL fold metallo-hydrolase [Chitinophagaceae bacterium]
MKPMAANPFSRKQFLRSAGLITAGLLLSPRRIFAQGTSPVITIKNAAATEPVNVQTLRGNMHVLSGSGGNISVFNGVDGKLMVDAGIGVSKPRVEAALQQISNKPVKYLVNSHWHFDHTDGNEWIHQAGATIIAQRQTKENLAKTIRVVDWDYTFTPAPAGALPTILFDAEHRLQFNGSSIHMKKYAPAHTNCDISVYFPHADVLHVADTWWNPYYPFIDHSSGGTLSGMISACNHNLSITTDKTVIVPGHGAVGNRAQLVQFRDMLLTVQHNVSKLKKEGRSLPATVAAKPTRKFDEKFGKFVLDGAFFTKLVYADV